MPTTDDAQLRVPRRPAEGLDAFDRDLVEQLRRDGRASNRALAKQLGANEVTIANRIKRLEDLGIMRVVAIADMAAFGRREMLVLFIRVVGRPVQEVAAEISALDDAIAVSVTTGRYDLVVIALASDHLQVARIVSEQLAPIRGIDAVRTELALAVHKYEATWAKLDPGADLALDLEPVEGFDELDIAVVRALQGDARQSNRRIAAELGVVEGTVRLRLKRMFDEGAIRIQALSDVVAFGVGAHAYVGIEIDGGHLAAVTEALRALPEVAVLMQSMGEFGLIAVVHAPDRQALIGLILQAIAATPGVRHTETIESVMTLKHTATWARIIDDAQ